MVVDVSEIKAFRHCKRQWQLSSRNQFHLTAKVAPKAFKLGTVFHECLHRLYLGKDIDFVTTYLRNELKDEYADSIPMITSMIKGYDREVMPEDREKFEVLDIEHHFRFKPYELLDAKGQHYIEEMGVDEEALQDIEVAGSIDMIALNTETNEVWGFEHKTAKTFRNDIYLWMDEQPRLYYAAMQLWVDEYNKRMHDVWENECVAAWTQWLNDCDEVNAALDTGCYSMDYPIELDYPVKPERPPEPTPVKLGGVYINEVRKLIRAFDYKRRALVYPEDDLRNFLLYFLTSCAECHKYVDHPKLPRLPLPDMMSCMNCMFNQVCREMQYRDLNKDKLLDQFSEVVKVREVDHLEEKEEVVAK